MRPLNRRSPKQVLFAFPHVSHIMDKPTHGYETSPLCPILTAPEDYVPGSGAKMFIIAGPVIVYGTVASVIDGVVCWILQMI